MTRRLALTCFAPCLAGASMVVYSIVVFGPFEMSADQSRYRLARYMATTASEAQQAPMTMRAVLLGDQLPVVGAVNQTSGSYQGVLDSPAFVEFDVPPAPEGSIGEVATKVTLDIPVRSALQQRIVHWQTTTQAGYSDNRFFRYPVSAYAGPQTLWIDGDVTRLRVLVTVMRGVRFDTKQVVLEKHVVARSPNPATASIKKP